MKHKTKIHRLVLTAVAGLGMTSASALASTGVYTSAQASRGQSVYSSNCASCHGAKLQGNVGPSLKGRNFRQMAKAQNLTGASLLSFISNKMPKTNPGSLSKTQYADVIAYILKQNGYPAGNTKLTAGSSKLKALKLAQGPSSSH